MIICNYGNSFNYELEKLTRLFLPFERIDIISEEAISERKAITVTDYKDDCCHISAKLFLGGAKYKSDKVIYLCDNFDKLCELTLANCLFDCLSEAFHYKPSWGILTGVRPARLYLQTAKKIGFEKSDEYFKRVLRVDENKLALLKLTAQSEEKIISLSKANSFSLYVSVPFCPSRCSYCSFVSHSVESAVDILSVYLEKLLIEIKETAKIVRELKLNLETVYIGGGTPTTLSAKELDQLISHIKSNFDFTNLREFTVECGRPDTITREKLIVLQNHNVTRICINPQTLNDNVLNAIGRRHTSKQFFESYDLAGGLGFNNINIDLIAGLPTDTFDSFKTTINSIIELSPKSVTVHSLSMKRSSSLTVSGFEPLIKDGLLATGMVDYAREKLINEEILPYYMYRQSKTVGNLENVGYAKPGFEGLYNVFIMDETHTILACGASAATKLKNPYTGTIKRIFNFKYPYEYINRFKEQILRKTEIYNFYNFL